MKVADSSTVEDDKDEVENSKSCHSYLPKI
jgi:hypothetical protein